MIRTKSKARMRRRQQDEAEAREGQVLWSLLVAAAVAVAALYSVSFPHSSRSIDRSVAAQPDSQPTYSAVSTLPPHGPLRD